jgi:hypothetical protein
MAASLINFLGRWRAYDVNGNQITYYPGDLVIFRTSEGFESTYLATITTNRTPLSGLNGGWVSLGGTGSTISGSSGGTGGRISLTYASSPPASPQVADQWFNSSSGRFFIYMNDGDSNQWVEIASIGEKGPKGDTGPAGGMQFTYGNTYPASPTPGDKWFDTVSGREFTYIYDGDSYQWVETF